MGISMPKIKAFGTSMKVPKLSIPKLKFVSKPSIGYAKPTMGGNRTSFKRK